VVVTIFSAEPKTSRDDLFDRQKELEALDGLVKRNRIILVTGIRRIGKTSLINVYLHEFVRRNFALVDVRTSGNSFRGIYDTFTGVLTKLNRWLELKSVLQGIRGVSVLGSGVSLSWGREARANLGEVFDRVDSMGVRTVIALDEAQRLRGSVGGVVLDTLAHCYDYCKNIVFVVTGSEVGLLKEFLRLEDTQSPLFGRHIPELRLEGFDHRDSIGFLRRGFEEAGLPYEEGVLERAVEYLDGVAGWLNEYGLRCVEKGVVSVEVAREVFQLAAKLEVEEVTAYSKNYPLILEALGRGMRRWSQIKRYLEQRLGRTLNDSELHRYLTNLANRGFIDKKNEEYTILNPILAKHFSED
jgi:AAA+ ATPase superfamily predicted ATPase